MGNLECMHNRCCYSICDALCSKFEQNDKFGFFQRHTDNPWIPKAARDLPENSIYAGANESEKDLIKEFYRCLDEGYSIKEKYHHCDPTTLWEFVSMGARNDMGMRVLRQEEDLYKEIKKVRLTEEEMNEKVQEGKTEREKMLIKRYWTRLDHGLPVLGLSCKEYLKRNGNMKDLMDEKMAQLETLMEKRFQRHKIFKIENKERAKTIENLKLELKRTKKYGEGYDKKLEKKLGDLESLHRECQKKEAMFYSGLDVMPDLSNQ